MRSCLCLLAFLGGWLFLLRKLLSQNLLDALLLFDEKCPHDAHADTRRTPRTSVGAIHTTLTFLEQTIFVWAQARYSDETLAAISAVRPLSLLFQLMKDKFTTRSCD